MADDDFDFEIYGDETNQEDGTLTEQNAEPAGAISAGAAGGEEVNYEETYNTDAQQGDDNGQYHDGNAAAEISGDPNGQQYEQSHTNDALPADLPQLPQQGLKRKSPSDEEPLEPGAAEALVVSELDWWVTDDVLRGWAASSAAEPQLKEITFSEHKVNGKSKGSAFLEFETAAASQAVKHHIEALVSSKDNPAGKKYTVYFQAPSINPYKNPPKDHTGRKDPQQHQGGRSGMGGMPNSFGGRGGGFQNRGGFNNRGGPGMGGYGNRGGFNSGMGGGGFNHNMGGGGPAGGFQNPMGGFGGPGGGGGNFGFNRGGPSGMMMGGGGGMPMRGGTMGGGRGGRGGGGGGFNPMMGGGMGGMAGMGMMGGMGGAMGGMGGMMGAGGAMPVPQPGFGAGFNPAFAGQGAGGWAANPHGHKRPRPNE